MIPTQCLLTKSFVNGSIIILLSVLCTLQSFKIVLFTWLKWSDVVLWIRDLTSFPKTSLHSGWNQFPCKEIVTKKYTYITVSYRNLSRKFLLLFEELFNYTDVSIIIIDLSYCIHLLEIMSLFKGEKEINLKYPVKDVTESVTCISLM